MKMTNMEIEQLRIAVIGLGYVGFPLLQLLSSKYRCVGLDINAQKVKDLQSIIKETYRFQVCNEWSDIANCNFYIVAVPTPVDSNNLPKLTALKNVCTNLATLLYQNDIVVFESTV